METIACPHYDSDVTVMAEAEKTGLMFVDASEVKRKLGSENLLCVQVSSISCSKYSCSGDLINKPNKKHIKCSGNCTDATCCLLRASTDAT